MRVAGWMPGVVALAAAIAAQAALAQGSADGGVPDDTLAPLVDENGPPRPPPPPPGNGGATASQPAAPAADEDAVLVQVSTRVPQPLEWAPSVVTVLTREDLVALGYRTLGEVLRNATGFDLNDDGAWPDTGARGLNAAGSHGELLRMMVDGHDMAWRQLGWNLHDRSWVDLDDVDRIEIVRGPTSALWGSGGISGAVNVVTRDWTRLKGAEATYGVTGALDGQFASARVGGVVGDVSLYGSFSYVADDADPALPPLRETVLRSGPPVRVAGESQEATALSLKARWRDVQLWLRHGHSDLGAPLSALSTVGGDDTRFVTDRTVARLIWSRELLPALDARVELALDQVAFNPSSAYENQPYETAVQGDPADDAAVGHFLRKIRGSDRRTEIHAQVGYAFGEGLRAAGGVDAEWVSSVRIHFPEVFAALGLATPVFPDLHVGAWADAQLHPFQMLELTGGARYDLDTLYGSTLTPRAAAVLHLPADLYVKGLYGSGFRAPSLLDLYAFQKNVAYGNPLLQPETSTTGELEIGYAPGSLRVSVAGFITRLNGLIGYVQRGAADPLEGQGFPPSQLPDGTAGYLQKRNGGFQTTLGAEAEVRFEPLPALVLQAQGSLHSPRDESDTRLYFAPEWTAGAAGSWRLTRSLTATLRVLATGDRPVPATALAEPGFPGGGWTAAEDPTPSAPASFIATAVLRAMLSDRVALELKLDNVTDTWWYDAGPAVLYPQRRFQATAWLSGSL